VWPSRPHDPKDQRDPSLSLGSHLLKEALLQAYVDDLLAPHRRGEVEQSLSGQPQEAARVSDFRSQNRELHGLFDRYFAEPTPDNIQALQRHLVKTLRRRKRSQAYGWAAAGALLIVGIAGSLAIGPPPLPPVAWSSDILRVLGGSAGGETATSDLAALGFRPIGRRRVGFAPNVVQHVYESADGRRVMVYESAAAAEDRARVSFTQEGAISVLFWTSEDRAFTLVGELDRESMLRFVNAVSGGQRIDRLRDIVMSDDYPKKSRTERSGEFNREDRENR